MSIQKSDSLNEIDSIKKSNLLNESDIDIVNGLTKELKNTFKNKEVMRTEFLARNSVLNDVKFPDCASKYWQSVREQDSQLTALVIDSFEYERALAQIEILKYDYNMIKGNNPKLNAQRKLKEIDIKEKEFLLINIKNNSHHRVRELALWEKIKQEQIKIDPSFDRVNVESSQRESFLKRWEKEKNIAIQTNQGALYRNVLSNLSSIRGENND